MQVKNMLLFRIKYLENKEDICTINMQDRDPKEKLSHAKSIFKERKRNSIITIRHLIMKCFACFSLQVTTKSLSLFLWANWSSAFQSLKKYADDASMPPLYLDPVQLGPHLHRHLSSNAVTTTFKTIGYVFGFTFIFFL